MNPVYSIALSGMNAASTRLANSANNVANANSTSKVVNGEKIREPYTPTDVIQTSTSPQGGVRAELRPRDPATTSIYAPYSAEANEDGIVELPNVSLEQEIVAEQIPATYDYKANLKVLKAADEMMDSMLKMDS